MMKTIDHVCSQKYSQVRTKMHHFKAKIPQIFPTQSWPSATQLSAPIFNPNEIPGYGTNAYNKTVRKAYGLLIQVELQRKIIKRKKGNALTTKQTGFNN